MSLVSPLAIAEGVLRDAGRLLDYALSLLDWAGFDLMKAVRLRLAIDFDNARPFLASLVRPEHGGYYNIEQVCDVWDYCNENWVYISDPYAPEPFDEFYWASETIEAKLRGDCDDFAILMAAAVRVLGGTALVVGEQTAHSGHAYTLVYLGGLDTPDSTACNVAAVMLRYGLGLDDIGESFFFLVDRDHAVWLSLDWNRDGHPGGPLWADPAQVVSRLMLPTPSVYGLLTEPRLVSPTPSAWCLQQMGR